MPLMRVALMNRGASSRAHRFTRPTSMPMESGAHWPRPARSARRSARPPRTAHAPLRNLPDVVRLQKDCIDGQTKDSWVCSGHWVSGLRPECEMLPMGQSDEVEMEEP